MELIDYVKSLLQDNNLELHNKIRLSELISEYEHERATAESRKIVATKIVRWAKDVIEEREAKQTKSTTDTNVSN
jgi:hypothetical protein